MQRPLLQVNDPLERLRILYNTRDPLYRETAHHVVDTGRPSMNRLLSSIIAKLDLVGFDTHASHDNQAHPSQS
jgi:shikimate kinase